MKKPKIMKAGVEVQGVMDAGDSSINNTVTLRVDICLWVHQVVSVEWWIWMQLCRCHQVFNFLHWWHLSRNRSNFKQSNKSFKWRPHWLKCVISIQLFHLFLRRRAHQEPDSQPNIAKSASRIFNQTKMRMVKKMYIKRKREIKFQLSKLKQPNHVN